ncbi:MAG: enoyl-CoA hydratase/isomerase family protein [Caldilineales bacterium]
MSDIQHWLFTVEHHVAVLTLNRPEAKNSITTGVLSELRTMTAELATDRGVWAIVLQGQGDHFSIGVDIDLIRSMLDEPERLVREQLSEMQAALDEFEAVPKPTIAKLRGFCIGGGLLLALCCDFRIASRHTVFALPEVKLGIPVLMGTQRLTQVTGVAAAKELVLLANRFNPETAHRLGLLHRVVPSDQLDAVVAKMADRFRRLPPTTVAVAKRIINEGSALSLRQSQDLELGALAQLLDSHDARKALESYLAGRESRYVG